MLAIWDEFHFHFLSNSDAIVAWYKLLDLKMFNLLKQQIISTNAKIHLKWLNNISQRECSPQKCRRRSEDSTLLPHSPVFPWKQGDEGRQSQKSHYWLLLMLIMSKTMIILIIIIAQLTFHWKETRLFNKFLLLHALMMMKVDYQKLLSW